jgi:PPOX class probable F420-dependent enzyme
MPEIPASHADLLSAPVAMLSTLGPDGFPQVTALWFMYAGGQIRLSLNTARQKVKNLMAHPECSFFILDTANPYRTLEIRARAHIVDDPDKAFARSLALKYGDYDVTTTDRANEKRVIVTLEPVKINTWGS